MHPNEASNYRVYRGLSFFSSRWNWDSPTPSPAGEFAPPPWFLGGEAHYLAGEGWGFNPKRGQTLWDSRYIYMYSMPPTLQPAGRFDEKHYRNKEMYSSPIHESQRFIRVMGGGGGTVFTFLPNIDKKM
jgi:hypothetical protein